LGWIVGVAGRFDRKKEIVIREEKNDALLDFHNLRLNAWTISRL